MSTTMLLCLLLIVFLNRKAIDKLGQKIYWRVKLELCNFKVKRVFKK